jgi:hypothetical protein
MTDLQFIRDIVVIVVGIIFSIIFLVILIVTLILNAIGNHYLGKAHDLIHTRAWPFVDRLQARAEGLRLQTAALPHRPVRPEAMAAPPSGSIATILQPVLALPSLFRRRKPWWRRVLPL